MVLAHAGHWTTQLLYVAPVAIVVLALRWQAWRERRQGDAAAGSASDPHQPEEAQREPRAGR